MTFPPSNSIKLFEHQLITYHVFMQNVQARDSFFSILMMFWRRENYLNYPVLVFHGEGARGGTASQGSPVGRVALWQAVWRKQVWGRYSSSLPFGPYQAAVLGGQKKAETAISFSLLEYHVLGHSQHTGRCHRVTSANLWISRIVSFLLWFFPPSFCFCLLSPCSGKGCPAHPHTFAACQGGVTMDWSLHTPEVVKRGDLLTFAFSQGAPYTVDLFVTNSGGLSRRRSVSSVQELAFASLHR